MAETFWMIVKLYDGFWPLGNKLEFKDQPKYMHTDKDPAEIELLRLKKRYPSHDFYLLETIATAEQIADTDVYKVEPME